MVAWLVYWGASLSGLDPAWIALIGTLFGGIGLKGVEYWLSKGKVKVDEATTMRSELRLEVVALREEVKQLRAEVDLWRKDYYDLRDQMIAIKAENILLKANHDKPYDLNN